MAVYFLIISKTSAIPTGHTPPKLAPPQPNSDCRTIGSADTIGPEALQLCNKRVAAAVDSMVSWASWVEAEAGEALGHMNYCRMSTWCTGPLMPAEAGGSHRDFSPAHRQFGRPSPRQLALRRAPETFFFFFVFSDVRS